MLVGGPVGRLPSLRQHLAGFGIDKMEPGLFTGHFVSSFEGDQPVGAIRNVRSDHGTANLGIVNAVLAVEFGVKFALALNSLVVEEDGRALGAGLNIAEVFNDDHNRRLLIDLSHSNLTLSRVRSCLFSPWRAGTQVTRLLVPFTMPPGHRELHSLRIGLLGTCGVGSFCGTSVVRVPRGVRAKRASLKRPQLAVIVSHEDSVKPGLSGLQIGDLDAVATIGQ